MNRTTLSKRKALPLRVAMAREKQKWTQAQMAFQINENLPTDERIAAVTVSNWETGRRRCPDKYVPIIARICCVEESFLYGDDMQDNGYSDESALYEVTAETLKNYDRKPLFVEFLNYQHPDGWCLYSEEQNRLVFLDFVIPLNAKFITSAAMKLYAKQPLYSITEESLFAKKCDLGKMLQATTVYIMMNTSDQTVKAMYNGWYRHNETHTALINSKGNVLPYDGFGISYMAYSPS